jgi:hypothetical protein
MLSALLLSSCALSNSIKARELLAKCKYELLQVNLKVFDFAPTISFDKSGKTFSLEKPGKELLPYIKQIKQGNFQLHFDKLSFEAVVGIDNPNNQKVIMDSLFFDTYLDKDFTAKVNHPEHLEIESGQKGKTSVLVEVPTNIPLRKALSAQNINLKGKVWLRLAIFTEDSEHMIPYDFDITRPVPRKEIQAAIAKEKKKVQKKLIKKVEALIADPALKKKAGSLLKKLF